MALAGNRANRGWFPDGSWESPGSGPGTKGDGRGKLARIHLRRRRHFDWDRAESCRRCSWRRVYRLAWLRDTKAPTRKIQEKEPGLQRLCGNSCCHVLYTAYQRERDVEICV